MTTAERFRALHAGLLVLPNAWDAGSARVIEAAGAQAIATTSAGVSWSLGAPDGGRLGVRAAVDAVARVVKAVDVPVTADIEDGYGDVTASVLGVVEAGAVGVNIEDGVEAQVARVAEAREAGGSTLFVNARIDTYLLSVGDPAERLAETVRRAHAYVNAGADGVFVPGVVAPDVITTLVDEVPAPLNTMAGPGAPTVTELGGLGVRRVSVGASIALAAYSLASRAARQVLTEGSFDLLSATLGYEELNGLFAK